MAEPGWHSLWTHGKMPESKLLARLLFEEILFEEMVITFPLVMPVSSNFNL